MLNKELFSPVELSPDQHHEAGQRHAQELQFLFFATYHEHFLIASVDSMVIDHAHNGHTQVTPDTKRDAEPQTRQDGDDVASGQAKAGTVHHWQFLFLHQLRTALC